MFKTNKTLKRNEAGWLLVSISPKRNENAYLFISDIPMYMGVYMYVHTDHERLTIYKLSSVFRFYCCWILLTQKY